MLDRIQVGGLLGVGLGTTGHPTRQENLEKSGRCNCKGGALLVRCIRRG